MRITAAVLRVVVIPLLAVASPALAQDEDAKLWTSTFAQLPLDEGLELDLESTFRFSDRDDGLYESIQALWIARQFDSGLTVAVGYQRNDSARRDPGTIENRLRQQVAGPIATIAGGRLTGQLRFEQRFRNDGDDIHYRVRPQIAYSRPFGEGSATSWSIRHESFFGSDADWNDQTGLFRFRHHVAIRHRLNDALQVEGGYLNQLEFGRDGDADSIDHVALISLTYSG